MLLFSSLHVTNRCFLRIKDTLLKSVKLKRTESTLADENHQIEKGPIKHCFIPFQDVLQTRRAEAQRSILVQVQSAQSYKELYSYCSSIGTVTRMLHYSVGVEPMNFIIVEFGNSKDVENILSESCHTEDPNVVPVHSNFLWFRATAKKLPRLKQNKSAHLSVEDGTKIMKEIDIKHQMKACSDVSKQMQMLYNSTCLNDVGTRLRFLTARQVENAVSGMFPNAKALPFGSSVNGFGKMGCDLDLVLRLADERIKTESRLIFHCKATTGSERTTAQKNMEAIGDLIQLFLPGCAQVRRILQARVPIIKYYQQLTDVECDLSMANLSGVHMSDFLYLMGSIDERVRPLVFAIRKWAIEVGLTNSSPGRWITNFSLTLLVLAFLQKPLHSPPILPTLNTLIKLSGPKDKFITEDGINCTFLRNMNTYKHVTDNIESLESLLREFFEFCSQFDYETKAVCLNEAVQMTKPEHCALYIVNPLERGLNVSKNVSLEELERFKIEARNAAWILESQENKGGVWGLLSILENKRKNHAINFAMSSKYSRLMEVSTLFADDENKSETNDVDYKSENVRKQVDNIKKEHRDKLKEMQKLQR